MKIKRSVLIAQLEAVRAGLSPKDIVDQASCFAFADGKVMTFNDEVACWGPSAFTPETGIAVPSGPLLSLLPKLLDEDLDLSSSGTSLVIKGKNKRTTIRVEAEVRLPINTVVPPAAADYFAIPDGFADGLALVEKCAGADEADFKYTCIHITPKWMEACDNNQVSRYRLKIPGLKRNLLIRKEAVKAVLAVELRRMAVAGSWLFFEGGQGMVIACRKHDEEYVDLTSVLEDEEGRVEAELPKGLGESAENAGVFSADNADDDKVLVCLANGQARITGEGAMGNHVEVKRVKYDGPPITFHIPPKLLQTITTNHPECSLNQRSLKVVVGRLTYLVSLTVVPPKTTEAE